MQAWIKEEQRGGGGARCPGQSDRREAGGRRGGVSCTMIDGREARTILSWSKAEETEVRGTEHYRVSKSAHTQAGFSSSLPLSSLTRRLGWEKPVVRVSVRKGGGSFSLPESERRRKRERERDVDSRRCRSKTGGRGRKRPSSRVGERERERGEKGILQGRSGQQGERPPLLFLCRKKERGSMEWEGRQRGSRGGGGGGDREALLTVRVLQR